jgi:hypothetical protein
MNMITVFTILGSTFGVIAVAYYNFHHLYLGLLFAIFSITSFMVALFSHFKKRDNAKTDKINIKDFTFIDSPGYYTHPDYSYWICPHCLIEKRKIAPVSEVDKNAWYCTVCKQPLSGSKGDVFSLDDYE